MPHVPPPDTNILVKRDDTERGGPYSVYEAPENTMCVQLRSDYGFMHSRDCEAEALFTFFMLNANNTNGHYCWKHAREITQICGFSDKSIDIIFGQ